MSYLRTEAHRQAARERAMRSRPWQHSTGPRTAEGKAASSMNRYRGGVRPMLRRAARVLAEQRRFVEDIAS